MINHDSELPRGLQDADFEMAGLQRMANRHAAARRVGKCTHGWRQVRPGQSKAECLDCGKTFSTEAEMDADGRANLRGF